MSPAIKVKNLSKKYKIGKQRGRYKTFREAIGDTFLFPIRKLSHPFKNSFSGTTEEKEIWALRDVSFEVQPGEVIGIIGRNGVGKTTLLKILSKITQPTIGRVEIRGRVGSLLEVGTGFHPELTGRENIYLNGSILGMRKAEIDRSFDEIVAFSEIEKFLDTPVKAYSSGMYVRLAFSIAAQLKPEILLVDEVLAVGDASFQKKCLNRMQDVGQEGRTVLFVSHNMPAIRSLCSRAILLDQGVIQYQGETRQVVQHYLGSDDRLLGQRVWTDKDRPGNHAFHLKSVKLRNASGEEVSAINISEEARIEIEYELIQEGGRAQFSLMLYDADGYCVFSSMSNTEPNFYGKPMGTGDYSSSCHLYGNLLNAGRFHVSLTGSSTYWTDSFTIDCVISFDAIDDGVLKGDYYGVSGGVVKPKLSWETVHK